MKIATKHVKVLHDLNIIHTDIKTDNYMFIDGSNINTLKLIDYSSSI